MSEQAEMWQWLVNGKPRSTPARKVWLVAGGSARVGVSTATALLARAAAASGRAVLLVDATGGQSSLHGGEPSPVGPTLVSLVAPAARPDVRHESVRARLRHVREQMTRFDLVLVDAGSRLATIRELRAALADRDGGNDGLLAVASPNASLAASFALIKVFSARFASRRVDLLVSGANADEAMAVFTRIQAATDRFLHRKIGFIGALPDEPMLHEGAVQVALRSAPIRSLPSDATAGELLQRMLTPAHPNIMAPTMRASHLEIHP